MNIGYFEKKNKEIEEKILALEEENSRNQEDIFDAIDMYEEYERTQKVFKVQFESCDRDGTFVGVNNNILIIMQGASTLEHMPYFIPQIRAKLMGYEFEVRVVQVDREKRRVYVESARDAERAIRNASKTELVRNLIGALEEGKKPRVWGKVKVVHEKTAYIDIFGEDVTGFISAAYWQKSYVRYLSTVCKEGEYYPFDVVGMVKRKNAQMPLFVLNREEIADDPWKNIPMDIIKKDALIYVKCIENPVGNKNWWGNSPLVPYIEILGLFPSIKKKGDTLQLIPGVTYKCRIRRISQVDEDRKGQNSLVVIPFAVADEDAQDYARMVQKEQMVMLREERNMEEQMSDEQMQRVGESGIE